MDDERPKPAEVLSRTAPRRAVQVALGFLTSLSIAAIISQMHSLRMQKILKYNEALAWLFVCCWLGMIYHAHRRWGWRWVVVGFGLAVAAGGVGLLGFAVWFAMQMRGFSA